jgi:hypothetical protein
MDVATGGGPLDDEVRDRANPGGPAIRRSIPANTSAPILRFWALNSTTGQGLTGLAFGTGSLVASYSRAGAAGVAITLVTAAVGVYTSGGFIAVDGTNVPGLYELHLPAAAVAAGVNELEVSVRGAANLADVQINVNLTPPPGIPVVNVPLGMQL